MNYIPKFSDYVLSVHSPWAKAKYTKIRRFYHLLPNNAFHYR